MSGGLAIDPPLEAAFAELNHRGPAAERLQGEQGVRGRVGQGEEADAECADAEEHGGDQ